MNEVVMCLTWIDAITILKHSGKILAFDANKLFSLTPLAWKHMAKLRTSASYALQQVEQNHLALNLCH